jgi:ABC-type transporter Mla subunit MlaD
VSTARLLPSMPRAQGRHREARVGLFAIVGLFAAWFALMTLTSPALFRGRYLLRTSVPDAAGIRNGDPVRMRGVNIGRVVGFGIGTHGVELRLEIEKAYDKVQSLAGEADKVTTRLQGLISDDTIRNVRDSSGQMSKLLRQVSGVVSDQRGEVQALSASLRKSAEGMERVTTGPELERVVKQVDDLSRRMDGLVVNLDRSATSLDAILGRLDHGEGTLGKLSRDAVLYDRASQAATDFDKAAIELEKLVEDIRRQPKKYINLKVF